MQDKTNPEMKTFLGGCHIYKWCQICFNKIKRKFSNPNQKIRFWRTEVSSKIKQIIIQVTKLTQKLISQCGWHEFGDLVGDFIDHCQPIWPSAPVVHSSETAGWRRITLAAFENVRTSPCTISLSLFRGHMTQPNAVCETRYINIYGCPTYFWNLSCWNRAKTKKHHSVEFFF